MATIHVGARIRRGRAQLSTIRGVPRLALTTEDKATLAGHIAGRFHLYLVDVDASCLVLEVGDIMCEFPGPEEVALGESQLKQITDAASETDDG